MTSENNEQFLKFLKMFMISGGLWQKPLRNSKMEMLYQLYSICMKTMWALFFVLSMVEFLRFLIQKYDTEVVIATLAIIINVIKITTKILIYLKNGVFDFVNDIIKREADIWTNTDDEIKIFYSKKIKKCQRFVTVQAITTAFATLAFLIVGIAGHRRLIEYNKSHNDTLESHYCFQIWLPFNKMDHVYIFYLIQTVLTWGGFNYNTLSHIVAYVLLIFIATQLEIFQMRIKKILSENNSVNEEEKLLQLKCLITDHQYYIRFAENLNKAIKNIILMEYVLSSIDIASITTSLTKVDTIAELGMNLVLLTLFSIQTFILAWTANEVKIQSQNVADAAFESNWYLLNKKGARLIHLMMIRAQKPLVINIGPFGSMTNESALAILDSSDEMNHESHYRGFGEAAARGARGGLKFVPINEETVFLDSPPIPSITNSSPRSVDSWMAFSNSSSDECSLSNSRSSSNEKSSDSDTSPQKTKRSCSLRLSDLDIEDSTEHDELIPQLASRGNIPKRLYVGEKSTKTSSRPTNLNPNPRVDIRIIDFAHMSFVTKHSFSNIKSNKIHEGPDGGFLTGLDSLSRLLSQILAENAQVL